jgi:hypothetical protein
MSDETGIGEELIRELPLEEVIIRNTVDNPRIMGLIVMFNAHLVNVAARKDIESIDTARQVLEELIDSILLANREIYLRQFLKATSMQFWKEPEIQQAILLVEAYYA